MAPRKDCSPSIQNTEGGRDSEMRDTREIWDRGEREGKTQDLGLQREQKSEIRQEKDGWREAD